MKKKVVIILGILFIVVIILLVIFLGDQSLDLESDEITNLYSYLGEVDIYHCGGLNGYTGEEVTYETLSNENKLCMAYYELSDEKKITNRAQATTTNENDISVCEIGEGTRLAANEGEEECHYTTISKEDLSDTYKLIYGQNLPDETSFYINGTEACYLEGEEYNCGNAETYMVSLTPEANIYRLMNKAVEKMNGDIVISDYYLRISGNKCYSSNNSDSEISACSSSLEDDPDKEITSEFVSNYGSIYEHTFKQDENGNYYWYSSNIR